MAAPTPDNLAWPTGYLLQSSEIANGAIRLIWDDGETTRLHPLWLRDNCACDDCLHPVTREHLIDLRNIPQGIEAQKVEINDAGDLQVTWCNGGHQSEYHPGWLAAHTRSASDRSNVARCWDSSQMREPVSFSTDHGEVSDALLHEVLLELKQSGLVRLRGMPRKPDTVENFALRIGPIRETHFARVFDVVSRPDGDSNAYTSEELAAHTDIPTRETPPGLQLLHCLVADAEGGLSTMTDGFMLAKVLKERHPAEYQNLTTTKWCFANRAGDTDYRWETPVIVLNTAAEVTDVRLLPFSRAPLQVEFDEIEPAYAALRLFMQLANSEEFQIRYPFTAGDLVIFDNRRILHGRGEFFPQTGDRELRGVYLDRDDMESTIRQFNNRARRA